MIKDKPASSRNCNAAAILLRTPENKELHFKNAGKDKIHGGNPGRAILIFAY